MTPESQALALAAQNAVELLKTANGRLDTPTDRRSQYRQRTYLGGLMITDEASTSNCIIRNLSPGGAMIQTTSQSSIPDNWLLIDIKNGMGYSVRTVWRETPRAGVRFLDRCDLKQGAPPTWEHVKGLWINLAHQSSCGPSKRSTGTPCSIKFA